MKKTVGSIATELLKKTPDTTDPIEIERELHTDYEKEIAVTVENGIKTNDGDFFVVVITKKEPLFENVLRNYFGYRKTCPTPDYDQAVYWYHRVENVLDFLWVIPSRETCLMLIENAQKVIPEEQELLSYVLSFANGMLYKLCKKLNKEP